MLMPELIALRNSRTDEQRLRTARRLRDSVRIEARAAGSSSSLTLSNMYSKLAELLTSPDTNDKLAGIFAVYELTDEPLPDNDAKLTRFAKALAGVHSSCTDGTVLRLASKALGRLARAGGTMTADFVKAELERPLAWLDASQPRMEHRRLAAVLIIRELADAAPAYVYPEIPAIFKCLWTALSDSKVGVREAAAKALASCLVVSSRRGARKELSLYAGLYSSARAALTGATGATSGGGGMASMAASFGFGGSAGGHWVDAVHGALMVIAELLASPAAAPFCAPRFYELCDLALKHRDSRERLVRRTVLALLPRLAHFSPEGFVSGYAGLALTHLLSCLRETKAPAAERGMAYLAVGRIALAVGGALMSDSLRPTLERIVSTLREGLISSSVGPSGVEGRGAGSGAGAGEGKGGRDVTGRGRAESGRQAAGDGGKRGREGGVAGESLACVAMLARAVGPALTEFTHELIDPMFRASLGPTGEGEGRLSLELTEALSVVTDAIPALRPLLQERLLHEISLLLAGRPFVTPYAPLSGETDGGGEAYLVREPHNAYGLLPPSLSDYAGGRPTQLATLNRTLASGGSAASADAGWGWGRGGEGGVGGGGGTAGGSGLHSDSASHSSPGVAPAVPFTFGWASSLAARAAGHSEPAGSGGGGGGGGGQGAGNPGPAGAPSFGQGGSGGDARWSSWSAGRPSPAALVGLHGPVSLARSRGVRPPAVRLALFILGSFDFSGVPLLPFVRECALLYVDDPDPAVRLEAALTCARLLVRPTELAGGLDAADPLLMAALFDAEAEMAADVAAAGEGEEEREELRHARAAAGLPVEADEEEDDGVIGVDVLGPVALLRAAGSGTPTNSHTLAALTLLGGVGGTEGGLDALAAGDAAARRAGAGVAKMWGDARSVPDVNPVAATLSSSYDTRRRHRAFHARVLRISRPPAHPLLVWGSHGGEGGGLGGPGLVYGRGGGWAEGPGAGRWASVTQPGGVESSEEARGSSSKPWRRAASAVGRYASGRAQLLGALIAVVGPGPTLLLISQVLQRLLVVGIADPDPILRYEVLCALDEHFDPLLVEPSSLRLLTSGLGDENFAVRERALAMLGRLVSHSPAAILPSLRSTLLRVLAELEYPDSHPEVGDADGSEGFVRGEERGESGIAAAALSMVGLSYVPTPDTGSAGFATLTPLSPLSGPSSYDALRSQGVVVLSAAATGGGPGAGREHAARMLALLVRASQRLVLPYVPLALRALLPATWAAGALYGSARVGSSTVFRDSTPPRYEVLSTCILAALGELSSVGADALLPHMHVLVPLVVDGLTCAAHILGVGPGQGGTGTTGAGASLDVGEDGGSGQGRAMGHLVLGASGVVSTVPPVRLAIGTNPLLFATVAVRTLGLLVGNTGQVVVPYMDHPHLLGLLMSLLARAPSSTGGALSGEGGVLEESAGSGSREGDGGSRVEGEAGEEEDGSAPDAAQAEAADGVAASGADRSDPTDTSSSSPFPGGGSAGWGLRREILRALGILGALDPYRLRMTLLAQSHRSMQAAQGVMEARLAAAIAQARASGRLITSAGLTPEALVRGVRAKDGAAMLLLGSLGDKDAQDDMTVNIDGLPPALRLRLALGLGQAAEKGAWLVSGMKGAPQVPADTGLLLRDGRWTGLGDTAGAAGGGTPWDLTAALPPSIGLALGGGMTADPMEAALAGLAGEPGSSVGVNLDEVGMAVGGGYGLWGMGGEGDGGGRGAWDVGSRAGPGGLGEQIAHTAGEGADGGEMGGADVGGLPASPGGAFGALAGLPARSILPSMLPSQDDFYPSVVLVGLLDVLAEPSLAVHHPAALDAVTAALQGLRGRAAAYLPRIMTVLLGLLRSTLGGAAGVSGKGSSGGRQSEESGSGPERAGSLVAAPSFNGNAWAASTGRGGGGGEMVDAGGSEREGDDNRQGSKAGGAVSAAIADGLRDAVLLQLAALLRLLRHGLRPWLPALFALIRVSWPSSLPARLAVVEAAAAAMGEIARPYIVSVLPHFLSVLVHDGTRETQRETAGPGQRAVGEKVREATGEGGTLTPGAPSSKSQPTGPRPERVATRHLLHTIAVLTAGGRRAVVGGSRRLLDDAYSTLIPAIARLVDVGVGHPFNAAGAAATVAVENGTSVAASRSASNNARFVPSFASNSSSATGYGPVVPSVRFAAITTLSIMAAAGVDLAPFASALVQPLARTLSDKSAAYTPTEVRRAALDCLALLLLQLRDGYAPWVPTVRWALLTGGRAAYGAGSEGVGEAGSWGWGGLSGAGIGAPAPLRHDAYDRLVLIVLGVGPECGGESGQGLYGYGPPPVLPPSPVELARLLRDTGTCSGDGTGARLAAALSLTTVVGEDGGALSLLSDGADNAWGLGIEHSRVAKLAGLDGPGQLGVDLKGTEQPKKLPMNQEALKRAWEVSRNPGKEDWTEWLRRLGLELLRESPSPALRAACSLAQSHTGLASDLFNASFVAVWAELYDEYSDSLTAAFEAAFSSPTAPPAVLRSLLGLMEFMERDDRAVQLPISAMALGRLAERVGAFAKALHYREREFVATFGAGAPGATVPSAAALGGSASRNYAAATGTSSQIVERLISINNALDAPEAAVEILKYAMQMASGVALYGYRSSHTVPRAGGGEGGPEGSDDGESAPVDQGGRGRLAGLPSGVDDGPLASARAARVAKAEGARRARPPRSGSSSSSLEVGGGMHAPAPATPTLRPPTAAGFGLDISETWYEKLGRWDDALDAYERKQEEAPNSLALVLGRMRCLKALGEWGRLEVLARSSWPRLEGNAGGRAAVAPLAARAAWALGRWADMDVYLRFTDVSSLQGAFFRAVLATHSLDFESAAQHIDKARNVLSGEIAGIVSLGSEGGVDVYGRVYRRLITVQQLAELEEACTYLRLAADGNVAGASAYSSHIRNVWRVRMRGVARNVDVWHRLLSVRSLVTLAPDNLTEWLQFASLARRSGRGGMALRVLLGLGLGTDSEAVASAARGGAPPLPRGLDFLSKHPSLIEVQGAGEGEGGLPVGQPDGSPTDGSSDGGVGGGPREVLAASGRVGAHSRAHPRVIYSYLKHLWHSGGREAALSQMRVLTTALDASAAARLSATGGIARAGVVRPGVFGRHILEPADENALRVQCHLRLGQWQEALLESSVAGAAGSYPGEAPFHPFKGGAGAKGMPDGLPATTAATPLPSTPSRMSSQDYEVLVAPVMAAFRTATHECGERGHGHYRAWHAWAIANFTVAEYHAESLRGGGLSIAHKPREGREGRGGKDGGQGGSTPSKGKGGRGGLRGGSGGVSKSLGDSLLAAVTGLSGVEEEEEDEEEEGDEGAAAPAKSASLPPSDVGLQGGFPVKAAITAHAVVAVKAFFRAIALGRTRLKAYILQDLLRLLTLMFKYAESVPVRLAVEAGLGTGAISSDLWLQVVPQLIARLHIPNASVKKLLTGLMTRIGTSHPQSLIYPLTVAVKSGFKARRDAAQSIFGVLRRVHSRLCDEADVVSRELIRVAILWHEQWHAALEDASRAYFGDGNIPAMLATLLPLHEMMSRPGPETARELAFAQSYGRDLDAAHKGLRSYMAGGKVADLTAAWEQYYAVFRRINKSLPSITLLDLQSCSPRLLQAYDLALSVPGTYTVGTPVVRIASVCPTVAVIASKQRPRRITLAGSDGRRYSFLLKGHEDLRQDERVMQLFGLVNTLLTNDSDTAKRDLAIRRYAVTPLSHAAGVVGWVPGCDTLHALIREFRDARKVLLNIEHRLMVQMAPPYDSCAVLQKVETFRYALDNTTGSDLAKVLWLKSASAEVWLGRRTAYVRSLAVMSMVGYVLGLGDRHPSNLMLDRGSGKILHIDFGDCFETAVTRDKFPERVPFRLTRMLVAAMEVAGVEGAFRSTAEAVMRVLRANRDSTMALLEAFVHDPLINWRLLATPAPAMVGVPAGPGAPGVPPAGGIPGAPAALPRMPVAPAAGLVRLVNAEGGLTAEQTAAVIQQGLAFAAEVDAGALATAAAETGIKSLTLRGAGGAADAGAPEGAANAAIARSLALTYGTARGGNRATDRSAAAMAAVAAAAGAAPGGDDTAALLVAGGMDPGDSEALNERAVAVLRRILAKLTGRDFGEGDRIGALMSVGIGLPPGGGAGGGQLASGVAGGLGSGGAMPGGSGGGGGSALGLGGGMSVPSQVHRLILAAMAIENLASAYVGWCAFW